MHLGGLLSTQEARVALGYHLVRLLAEGHFVCACSSEGTVNEEIRWYAPPKCKEEMKQMAILTRNPPGITVFFFLFALYNLDESVEKSKYGCSVCRKKSQLSPFQKAKAYTDDLDSCFGIRTAIDDDKLICEGYRRAVQEHRRIGKSFHHVSAVSSYS